MYDGVSAESSASWVSPTYRGRPLLPFVEPHFIAAMAVAKLVENQRTGSPFRICAKGRE